MSLQQHLLSLGLPAIALCSAPAVSLSAQQPVTREQAVAAALARAADLPLDLPWIRSARIGAAASARDAARYNFAFERAAIRFDVDTAYTRALAALARARLSRRNALDADSLRKMAQLRREVGDVSELDVRLAAVNAGQLENVAADDSIAAVQAHLSVQLAMGLPAEEVTVTLADSLAPPADSIPAPAGEPLPVAAAAASFRASEHALSLARRTVFAAPSLQVGFDTRPAPSWRAYGADSRWP